MSAPIHILLVEDNAGDADLVRDALDGGELDVDIDVVVDGSQAIDYIHNRPPFTGSRRPDLVLLDLNLPKQSGHEVLAEMRRHQPTRRVPVVILSSSDAELDIAETYEMGANCYLTKPVGIVAFQSMVRLIEYFWLSVVKLP